MRDKGEGATEAKEQEWQREKRPGKGRQVTTSLDIHIVSVTQNILGTYIRFTSYSEVISHTKQK